MSAIAAIALSTAVKYVAAAYAAVWLLTLAWIWLIRGKLSRMERQLDEAERVLAARAGAEAESAAAAAAAPERVGA